MDYTIFGQEESVYREFLAATIPHKIGYYILAPSGTGKTHFIKHQLENHWTDGDLLWEATGAHPKTEWWNGGLEMIKEVDARSDVVTAAAKRLGLWVLGASNNWLRPDAVVLPDWKTNVKYIAFREKNNYDGGLKTSQLQQLKNHRAEIRKMAKQKKVPIFLTVQEATEYISKLNKTA